VQSPQHFLLTLAACIRLQSSIVDLLAVVLHVGPRHMSVPTETKKCERNLPGLVNVES